MMNKLLGSALFLAFFGTATVHGQEAGSGSNLVTLAIGYTKTSAPRDYEKGNCRGVSYTYGWNSQGFYYGCHATTKDNPELVKIVARGDSDLAAVAQNLVALKNNPKLTDLLRRVQQAAGLEGTPLRLVASYDRMTHTRKRHRPRVVFQIQQQDGTELKYANRDSIYAHLDVPTDPAKLEKAFLRSIEKEVKEYSENMDKLNAEKRRADEEARRLSSAVDSLGSQ